MGVGVFAVLATIMIFAQLARPFRWLLRILGGQIRSGPGARLFDGAAALEEAVIETYRRRRPFWAAMLWRLVGWFAGAGEFWLALHFLGSPVGLVEAIMLESLVQAVRTAAFMVPGGIGLQEAALVALAAPIGLSPDIAIALSLIKRVRELLLGSAGLLAWYWLEHRHVRLA
jgi:uncharacterized membrane protein YbhN (UPF0104 family)